MPASPAQRGWCLTEVSEQTLAAYDAPFPTQEFAVGARRSPMLVPITVDDPERLKGGAAWEVLGSFTKPVLTLWGDHCPHTYTEQGEQFRAGIPGARLPGIEHKVFRASHYIQEDLGPPSLRVVSVGAARSRASAGTAPAWEGGGSSLVQSDRTASGAHLFRSGTS